MATTTMTFTTTPYGSFGQPPPQTRTVIRPGSWSSVTVPGSAKSIQSADDWSSHRMALPNTYSETLAGYTSGLSRPYDIYRLTAHVNVDLLNFLHSSEESFEARLMAGGYVGYGSSLGARMIPNATMHPQTSAASTSYPALQAYAALYPPPDELTSRKRRRLDAFRREKPSRPANLRPVEVEGRGRMLLDFSEDNQILQRVTPVNILNKTEESKRNNISKDLAWPDEHFPWNLRNHERIQHDRMKRDYQLRCIERFLEIASDEEEEEEEDETIFREAGYYSIVQHPVDPLLEVDVERSSGTTTPSWMTLTQATAQPDPITSSRSKESITNAQSVLRTNTMQLLAKRGLRKPCAVELISATIV